MNKGEVAYIRAEYLKEKDSWSFNIDVGKMPNKVKKVIAQQLLDELKIKIEIKS